MSHIPMVRTLTIGATILGLILTCQTAQAGMKQYTFGSMLFRVKVPGNWKKVEQTTKRVKFKYGKAGSLSITRKFGKKNIHKIAEAVKAGWRAKNWRILMDKRGKLKGTNHPAMMLRAHHPGAKAKIALYVVNVRKRIYVVMFGNRAKKFKPKLYNKIMLTFDAI